MKLGGHVLAQGAGQNRQPQLLRPLVGGDELAQLLDGARLAQERPQRLGLGAHGVGVGRTDLAQQQRRRVSLERLRVELDVGQLVVGQFAPRSAAVDEQLLAGEVLVQAALELEEVVGLLNEELHTGG